MVGKACVIVWLVAGFHGFIHAQDCQKVPAVDFEEEGLFRTELFLKREETVLKQTRSLPDELSKINADYIEELLRGRYGPSEDLAVMIAAQEEDDRAVEAGKDVAANINNFVAPVSYHTTCPIWWYLVPRGSYYTTSIIRTKTGVTYRYCWSYTRYWIARCRWRNCYVANNHHYQYGFAYRCVPEYRTIRIWVLCLEITIHHNGGFSVAWVKRYIAIRVPYSCCCRRYYGRLAPNFCAAQPYQRLTA